MVRIGQNKQEVKLPKINQMCGYVNWYYGYPAISSYILADKVREDLWWPTHETINHDQLSSTFELFFDA